MQNLKISYALVCSVLSFTNGDIMAKLLPVNAGGHCGFATVHGNNVSAPSQDSSINFVYYAGLK